MVLQQLKSFCLLILKPVRLVDHYVDEWDFLEHRIEVGHEHLERGNQYVELVQLLLLRDSALIGDIGVEPLPVANLLPPLRATWVVVENRVKRCPLVRNPLPVLERRQRSQDQIRPAQLVNLVQVVEQRQSHDGLAQTHLVGKHYVSVFVPRPDQPVEPGNLVVLQLLVRLLELRDDAALVAVLDNPVVSLAHDLDDFLVE